MKKVKVVFRILKSWYLRTGHSKRKEKIILQQL